jgi:hypothetical protein
MLEAVALAEPWVAPVWQGIPNPSPRHLCVKKAVPKIDLMIKLRSEV